MSKKYIPNWDNIACLVDRISIECVKQGQFQSKLDNEPIICPNCDKRHTPELTEKEKTDMQFKVSNQEVMRLGLRNELIKLLKETYNGEYDFLEEKRTFS